MAPESLRDIALARTGSVNELTHRRRCARNANEVGRSEIAQRARLVRIGELAPRGEGAVNGTGAAVPQQEIDAVALHVCLFLCSCSAGSSCRREQRQCAVGKMRVVNDCAATEVRDPHLLDQLRAQCHTAARDALAVCVEYVEAATAKRAAEAHVDGDIAVINVRSFWERSACSAKLDEERAVKLKA